MSELSPEARALFASARGAGAPPADTQSRIREALRAQGPSPVVKAHTVPVVAKLLSAVVLALTASWGIVRALPHRTPPPTITPAAVLDPPRASPSPPSPTLAAAPRLTPPPAQAVVVAPPRERLLARSDARVPRPRSPLAPIATPAAEVAAPPAPAPVAAPPALGIAEEVRLITAAREALRGHDGARALATLDEHQRRFPHAALATEATAVRILALCAQRRADEARILARSWFATAGQSPLAANLRQSCAGDAP